MEKKISEKGIRAFNKFAFVRFFHPVPDRKAFLSNRSSKAMNSRIRFACVLFHIFLWLFLCNPHSNAAAGPIARITGFQGEVILLSGNTFKEVKKNADLMHDDWIQTENGYAEITFNDGAVLKVRKFSSVFIRERMEKPDQSTGTSGIIRRITCFVGALIFNRGISNTESYFQTSKALAGIRGTQLGVKSPDKATLDWEGGTPGKILGNIVIGPVPEPQRPNWIAHPCVRALSRAFDNPTLMNIFSARALAYQTMLRNTYLSQDEKRDLEDQLNSIGLPSSTFEPGGRLPAASMVESILAFNRDRDACFVEGCLDYVEDNSCRKEAVIPNDPYFKSKGAWGQSYDDQWAIKRVGYTEDEDSVWNMKAAGNNPVVVAVIDTGLDWNHKDIAWGNIWNNPGEIPDNGKDDDNNGYVDDIIGWNFIGMNNKPWDEDGHGTFVTGIIAATHNNGIGIAGINRNAKVMVLKALNDFGHTRASFLSEAIFYAADNGARVINISAGGKRLTRTEQEAVDYAFLKGALVVVAAGNEALDTVDYSPAGLRNVITVAATGIDDRRGNFSNWGMQVDIAAPGMDVLSLRARRTDFMEGVPDIDYRRKLGFVGRDARYYRASGTSFSAPIVAGTASLIFSRNPELTNVQVMRMLKNSARDIEVPGVDQYSGYGLLDAGAAVTADPDFFLEALISEVSVVEKGGRQYIRLKGTADSDQIAGSWVEIGQGKDPKEWKKVTAENNDPVRDNMLGDIEAGHFSGSENWVLRLIVKHKNGKTREARFALELG